MSDLGFHTKHFPTNIQLYWEKLIFWFYWLFLGIWIKAEDEGVFLLLSQLRCCGFINYTDFVGSKFENETKGSLPFSCCWTNSTTCSRDEAQSSGVQVRKYYSDVLSLVKFISKAAQTAASTMTIKFNLKQYHWCLSGNFYHVHYLSVACFNANTC